MIQKKLKFKKLPQLRKLLNVVMKESGCVILSSRVIGLVLLLCLVHTSRKGKHDYSFTNEYFGLRFPHSTSVKVANWDSRLCIIENTKWRDTCMSLLE